jgi:hypothetical protein
LHSQGNTVGSSNIVEAGLETSQSGVIVLGPSPLKEKGHFRTP